ncbi:MAG: hypothetical protein AABX66_00235 [Nanoarchaeota archaeon]
MVYDDYDKKYREWKDRKKSRSNISKNVEKIDKKSNENEPIRNNPMQSINSQEKYNLKDHAVHHSFRVLAFVIPILIILFFVYINYTPFGYSSSYEINISENGNVVSSSNNAYLTDLKGNKINNLSNVYDYGAINLVVNAKVVLKDASINVSIEGNDSYFTEYLPYDFSKGDYFWNFSKRIPFPLNGTAKYDSENKFICFNASNNETLNYPNSSEMFEEGSFVIYAKWKPENPIGINQQIIGHYNWELWQSNNSVKFMVGRLDNKTGTIPSIAYPINSTFFGEAHNAIAVYNTENDSKGYIELWVDGEFAGRKGIGDERIWRNYNLDRNLSFGWSPHNYENNSYYAGCVYEAGFDYGLLKYKQNISFISSGDEVKIKIIGKNNPNRIKISISQ